MTTESQKAWLDALENRLKKLDDPDPDIITNDYYVWILTNLKGIGKIPKVSFGPHGRDTVIFCADNGAHIGLDAKGKFVLLLKQHGVSFDDIPEFKGNGGIPKGIVPIDPKPKVKGKSKLKKWTCGCQIVRVGKREFSATCDICQNKFELDE